MSGTDDFMTASLQTLEQRLANLKRDIDDAAGIAGAMHNGNVKNWGRLPAIADHYFPDAAGKPLPLLNELAREGWSKYFFRQTYWDITLLREEMQTPVIHRLQEIWANVAPWNAQDQEKHEERVRELTHECHEGIAMLKEEGFTSAKLEKSIDDILQVDYNASSPHIATRTQFLVLMDKRLRTLFRAFSENAGSALETSRNDMSEAYLVFQRRSVEKDSKRIIARLVEDISIQGERSLKELDRAAGFCDMGTQILQRLAGHTQVCITHLDTFPYAGAAPRYVQ